MKKVYFFILVFLLAHSAQGQKIYTPQAGTPERKVILDKIRPEVEDSVIKNVKFKVSTFKIRENWAFVNGMMLDKNEKPLDESAIEARYGNDTWDNNFQALLKKVKGQWTIVQVASGCSDVCWIGWDEAFKAPKAIFPYN